MTYYTSLYRPMPQLAAATTLAGTELMRVYQSGEERQTPVTAVLAAAQPLDADLTAIAALATTGLIARTGAGTVATRTVTASTGITVANGSGVSGNPTVSITNSGVSAATYGSATAAPQIAVNAQGQITSAADVTVTPAVGSITGLGTGVGTFLATPSSANLAAAVTGETGSGALVFGTSPALSTPVTTPTTVAGLPAAATAGAGARSFVTDANATTFASIVAAGGANGVPCFSDGTDWRIG